MLIIYNFTTLGTEFFEANHLQYSKLEYIFQKNDIVVCVKATFIA